MNRHFYWKVFVIVYISDRPDAAQANLRSAAYEALMEMVKNSPKDCYVTVQKTIMVILERLQQVLQMEARIVSQSDRVQYNDLQSLLCATLQVQSSLNIELKHSNLSGAGTVFMKNYSIAAPDTQVSDILVSKQFTFQALSEIQNKLGFSDA